MKQLLIVILIYFYSTSLFSQWQPYSIRAGDILSRLVEQTSSPPPPLYGKNGRLQKVLNHNNISNPNLIYPAQVILLPTKKPLLKQNKIPVTSHYHKKTPNLFKFNFTSQLGIRFLMLSQTGALGNSDIHKLLLPIKLKMITYNDNYQIATSIETFKSPSSTNYITRKTQAWSFTFNLSPTKGRWKDFTLGIWDRGELLYKYANNTAFLSTLNLLYLTTSWKKNLYGHITGKLRIGFPILGHSFDELISTKSSSGYLLSYLITTPLKLFSIKKLQATIDLGMQQISTTPTWQLVTGKIDYSAQWVTFILEKKF